MGDSENALDWFYKSLENPNASKQIQAWATHNLGKVYKVRNDHKKAEAYLLKSLAISAGVNYDVLSTASYLELSTLFFEKKEFSEAEQYAQSALSISERIGSKEESKTALNLIAQIKESLGDLKGALIFYKKHLLTFVFVDFVVNLYSKVKFLSVVYI